MFVSLIVLLGVALFCAALRFGATVESAGAPALMVLGIAGWLAARDRRATVSLPRGVAIALGLAVGIVTFQLVPIPVSWIDFLSPQRAETIRGAAPLFGSIQYSAISVTPIATFHCTLGAAACILLLAVVRSIASRGQVNPWIVTLPLVALGVFESSVGLMQQSPAPVGTFYYRNHYASNLALCLPFPFMWGAALARRAGRSAPAALGSLSLFGAGALILIGIARSGSRMGYSSCVLALIAIGLANAFAGGPAAPRAGRWRIAATVILIGGLAFFVLAPRVLIDRFSATEEAAVGRAGIWGDAARAVRAYPLTGCGYCAYWAGGARFQTTMPAYDIDYAHNDYLQLTSEIGIPGMLALLTAAALIVRWTFRHIRTAPALDHRYRSLACLAAFVAIGTHSFVDFNLYFPVNLLTLAWIAGMGIADTGSPEAANA